MAFGMWAVLERQAATTLGKPDYSRSLGDIYMSFAVYLMQVTHSADVLLYAAARSFPGQPSWVPDWTARASVGRYQDVDDYGNRRIRTATRSLLPHIEVGLTESVLKTRAYHMATVSMCVEVQKTSTDFK